MSEALTEHMPFRQVLTAEFGRTDRSHRVVGLFIRLLARAAQGALTLLPETCFSPGSIVDALPEAAWESFCGPFRSHATQGPVPHAHPARPRPRAGTHRAGPLSLAPAPW